MKIPAYQNYDWGMVKKADIRIVVKDHEWQKLRESLLGKWKEHEHDCRDHLVKYLGDMTNPWKIRRVLNYLTGSGFRMGKIGQSPDTKDLLDMIRSIYEKETPIRMIIDTDEQKQVGRINLCNLRIVRANYEEQGKELLPDRDWDLYVDTPEDEDDFIDPAGGSGLHSHV